MFHHISAIESGTSIQRVKVLVRKKKKKDTDNRYRSLICSNNIAYLRLMYILIRVTQASIKLESMRRWVLQLLARMSDSLTSNSNKIVIFLDKYLHKDIVCA